MVNSAAPCLSSYTLSSRAVYNYNALVSNMPPARKKQKISTKKHQTRKEQEQISTENLIENYLRKIGCYTAAEALSEDRKVQSRFTCHPAEIDYRSHDGQYRTLEEHQGFVRKVLQEGFEDASKNNFGQRNAARDLRATSKMDKNISRTAHFHSSTVTDYGKPDYERIYWELHRFVQESLETFKQYLRAVLFPVFVHMFLLMHLDGYYATTRNFLNDWSHTFQLDNERACPVGAKGLLTELERMPPDVQLDENAIATRFIQQRYHVSLSSAAHDLLVGFLHDQPHRHVVLRILNKYIFIHVEESHMRKIPVGFRFANNEKREEHVPNVRWGRLLPEEYKINDEHVEHLWSPKSKGESKIKSGLKQEKDQQRDKKQPYGTTTSKIPIKRFLEGANELPKKEDWDKRIKLNTRLPGGTLKNNISILFFTIFNRSNEGPHCIGISVDGSRIASGFGDASVRVWDMKSKPSQEWTVQRPNSIPRRFVGHSEEVYSTAWSNCGEYVLSASGDGIIVLWNSKTGAPAMEYKGHIEPVWSVAMAPMGHYFASGGMDNQALVWATSKANPLRILAGHTEDVNIVKWHPNCNYLATGSSDLTVRLWDVSDGSCVRVLGPEKAGIFALSFSPDGRTIACGGDAGDISIWDIVTGKLVRSANGHSGSIWALEYSVEGAVLASGGEDGVFCLWDAAEWSTVVGYECEDALKKAGDCVDGAHRSKEAEIIEGVRESSEPSGGEKFVNRRARNWAEHHRFLELLNRTDIPLIQRYETKDSDIQALRFTPKNVLIACGRRKEEWSSLPYNQDTRSVI